MGQKNLKGTVSISNVDGRIRLRWRYQGKRYSINLAAYTKLHLTKAKTVAALIEKDMAFDSFDYSLNRYKGNERSKNGVLTPEKTIVGYFEEWASVYKQMDCETHIDYYSLRNTLKKWGKITEQNMLINLNSEKFSPQTYNKRLSTLKGFAKWLVKLKIWASNPLEEVDKRKVKKVDDPTRKPFTEEEIGKILSAFKNDTYSVKSAHFPHSHYYPFLYFIFKTGVRNGEAVGLRVSHIDFVNKFITIKEVMARNAKGGTNAAQRIRKETKNGKVRHLPLTADLEQVLTPVCQGKKSDDLVFQSFSGQCIDDRMFQRRVFKPILKELKIEERVLYACRHTFGSRCIDSGITPVMTAFLMGNNPETALRNYTHQISIPDRLPKI
jgi:integrase